MKKKIRALFMFMFLVMAVSIMSVPALADDMDQTEISAVQVSNGAEQTDISAVQMSAEAEQTDGSDQNNVADNEVENTSAEIDSAQDNDATQIDISENSEEKLTENSEGENISEQAEEQSDIVATVNGSDAGDVVAQDSIADALENVVTSSQTETIIAEDVFEETGIFGCTVTDVNGVSVNSWYDSSDNMYYMFLTSAVSIPELTLEVKGIRMEKTSKGTLDTITNYVTLAFENSGDAITLTSSTGDKYNVTVKQSGLASINITLNGTTLDTINSGSKDTKYEDNSIVIYDASGNLNVSQSGMEIKGRGNSTWTHSDKKPYQIKLDKKASVLGMDKAKKWILLANAFDDSMVRNQVAFYMAESLGMSYVPDYEYADLWIDGEYLGTYMIGEKVEIDSKRLNLTDTYGVLAEYDSAFYEESDYYIYNAELDSYFVLKDAVSADEEDISQRALELFNEKVHNFCTYLFNSDLASITMENLSRYIDVDSFAKWYLVDEYLSNVEAQGTSWYWYMDGSNDVIHMGPVWDFDSCMGNYSGFNDTTLMFLKDNMKLLSTLMNTPVFCDYLNTLIDNNRSVIANLSDYALSLKSIISMSAEMNYIRWKWLGDNNPKPRLLPYATTYAEAVSNLVSWLNTRRAGFLCNPTADVTYTLSSTGKSLTVRATNVLCTSSLSVAIWNNTGGQDDLQWYTLNRNADASYSIIIDLTAHGGSDIYYAHVYSNYSYLIGGTSIEVKMDPSVAKLTAVYSQETGMIFVDLSETDAYTVIYFPTWSEEKGQDDIIWYSVKADNGTASTLICPAVHGSTGTYYVHAYGYANGRMQFIAATETEVDNLIRPEILVVRDENSNNITITIENVSCYTNLSAAVWGDNNWQNDLQWYSMQQVTDGNGKATVNLTDHEEKGRYYIHIYGYYLGRQCLINGTTYMLDALEKPQVTASALIEGAEEQLLLTNVSGYSSVLFAVWGDNNWQNDLVWYKGEKNAFGEWTCTMDLLPHGETGTYHVHVYGEKNGLQSLISNTDFEVEKLDDPVLDLRTSVSGRTLKVSLESPYSYSNVQFAVWGEKNGQNDLRWYNAEKNNVDGSWYLSIDVVSHEETGIYFVHAYGERKGTRAIVTGSTIDIQEFLAPQLSMIECSDGKSADIELINVEDYSSMKFAVWTGENGQDDLIWYDAVRYSDGSFHLQLDEREHGGNGSYIIHAYGTKNDSMRIIKGTTLTVDSFEESSATVVHRDESNKIDITLDDKYDYAGAKVAVWGEINGQNDIKWYSMEKASDGTYTASVDLTKHGETGKYYIHVYGDYSGKSYFAAATEINIDNFVVEAENVI